MRFIWEEKDIHAGRELEGGNIIVKAPKGQCGILGASGTLICEPGGKFMFTEKELVEKLNKDSYIPSNLIFEMPF